MQVYVKYSCGTPNSAIIFLCLKTKFSKTIYYTVDIQQYKKFLRLKSCQNLSSHQETGVITKQSTPYKRYAMRYMPHSITY